MGSIVTVSPDIDLPENPVQGEMVHGGFRSNPHHQYIEDTADPRHMGRELLKANAVIETADTAGYDEIMAAASPVGKDGMVYSKWSK